MQIRDMEEKGIRVVRPHRNQLCNAPSPLQGDKRRVRGVFASGKQDGNPHGSRKGPTRKSLFERGLRGEGDRFPSKEIPPQRFMNVVSIPGPTTSRLERARRRWRGTSDNVEALKKRAAHAALGYVRGGMVVGLGTGSTARHVLEGLARLVADGTTVKGIPTSLATARAAKTRGIPLTSLEEHPHPDVAIDGADEVDSKLNLIKGLGGALFREKIVAEASKKFIVVVDESKLVPRLGSKAPARLRRKRWGPPSAGVSPRRAWRP